MIKTLKLLLDDLKRINEDDTIHYNKTNIKAYILYLETAIEILEKLKNKGDK
jgi:hypothetical protein